MTYRVIHQGFDTLDLAIKGALAEPVLEKLEAAREVAEERQREQAVTIGPARLRFLVQPHGQRGGFRYVLANGPTGAVFAIKANHDPDEWNLFTSARAACLLTKGYEPTKQWLFDTFTGMGAIVRDHSINRVDYAVDILTPDFALDMANFVTPGHAKVGAYWEDGYSKGEPGAPLQSVMRGGRFESVTVGKMPGRQVILYDKRRAAIELKQPHWFKAWGIDRSDPAQQVWRVEVRAGKRALEKRLFKRSFEAVDADLPAFLQTAVREIRYTVGKDGHRNVSRAETHPLWETATDALHRLPVTVAPPLPEAHVLRFMQAERRETSIRQAFGNLINAFVLDGVPKERIEAHLPGLASRMAARYVEDHGEAALSRKIAEAEERLMFLRTTDQAR